MRPESIRRLWSHPFIFSHVMFLAGIAFTTGVVAVQQFACLPSLWFVVLTACVLFAFWVCVASLKPKKFLSILNSDRRRSILNGFFWLSFGLCHALWSGHSLMQRTMPVQPGKQDVTLTAQLIALPKARDNGWQIVVQVVNQDAADDYQLPDNARLQLNYYIRSSQTWQPQLDCRYWFTARIKAPMGPANPGGSDRAAQLISQGLTATGYLRSQPECVLLEPHNEAQPPFWLSIRYALLQRIQASPLSTDNQAVFAALTIGDRQMLSAAQWQTFQRTGTGHLIAISGLHVGLLAGFIWLLAHPLLRLLYAASLQLNRGDWRWLPAQWTAVITLTAAWSYAHLAGFSLSTQRAAVMLSVFMLAVLLKRRVLSLNTFGLALIVVLLYDPFAVTGAGFWLSFGAVLILLVASQGRGQTLVSNSPGQTVYSWVRLQLIMILGMLPLSLFWFQQAPTVSALVNLLAIPFTTIILVPLVLLTSLLNWPICWQLSQFSLDGFQMVLQWVAEFDLGQWAIAPSPGLMFFSLIAVLILLLPAGFKLRRYLVFLIMPLVTAAGIDHGWLQTDKPSLKIVFLDVGQGTSVVIQMPDATWVYDTGPTLGGAKFGVTGPDFTTAPSGHSHVTKRLNAGQLTVVPYLRQAGIRTIDRLIISHSDDDHLGGANAVLQAYPVDTIHYSDPATLDALRSSHAEPLQSGEPCVAGQQWRHARLPLTMTMLHPTANFEGRRNDRSCVLLINYGGYRILLPGDIERKAERHLLQNYPDLNADIVMAPHHGSRTSSSPAWVDRLQPDYVVYTSGYLNRYRHPASVVVERYRTVGATALTTGYHGAVSFTWPELQGDRRNKVSPAVTLYRQTRARYWQQHDALLHQAPAQ